MHHHINPGADANLQTANLPDAPTGKLLRMFRSNAALRVAQSVFWGTLLFTFVCAEVPADHALQLFPWDKAEHFTAFYVLSTLAAAAFPRRSLIILGLWLSLFGVMIELVQALPFIHRDADIFDWVADAAGISAAYAPWLLLRWRALQTG